MTVAAASPGITVAGRSFRPVTTFSVERYNWLLGHLSDCGLAGAETRGEIMARISAAGKTYAILAGELTEVVRDAQADGEVERQLPWDGPTAARNAAFFAGLRDLRDIMVLHPKLVEVAEDFFYAVAVCSGDTATLSSSSDTTLPLTSEAPRNEPATATPSGSSGLPCEPVPGTT